MLRIQLMQQWYNLSDPAMEDSLIEVPTMRRFAGIDLISDRIPDETTILSFRHLLEKHDLRRHLDRSPQLHEEQEGREGSRDAPDPQGKAVVFRDESPHRCGQG
jgi:IS5 family transposase